MHSVVVLNRNYEFYGEVNIKKVLKWLIKEKIEIVASKDDEEIRSVEFVVKMPMVVRLLYFVGYKIKGNTTPYNDYTVFNRDNNICQYFHKDSDGRKYKHRCTEDERTIDHVIPKSRGGKTSFENCVTACRNCNTIIKKDRLPMEAGLELIRKPVAPTVTPGEFAVFRFAYNPNKLSHRFYLEKVLGTQFSEVV